MKRWPVNMGNGDKKKGPVPRRLAQEPGPTATDQTRLRSGVEAARVSRRAASTNNQKRKRAPEIRPLMSLKLAVGVS